MLRMRRLAGLMMMGLATLTMTYLPAEAAMVPLNPVPHVAPVPDGLLVPVRYRDDGAALAFGLGLGILGIIAGAAAQDGRRHYHRPPPPRVYYRPAPRWHRPPPRVVCDAWHCWRRW